MLGGSFSRVAARPAAAAAAGAGGPSDNALLRKQSTVYVRRNNDTSRGNNVHVSTQSCCAPVQPPSAATPGQLVGAGLGTKQRRAMAGGLCIPAAAGWTVRIPAAKACARAAASCCCACRGPGREEACSQAGQSLRAKHVPQARVWLLQTCTQQLSPVHPDRREGPDARYATRSLR